jgi:capsular polysaccharide biosynthesis protein
MSVDSSSMAWQAFLFRAADVVVAPHGAGLAASMFCRSGTRVLEVLPDPSMAPPSTFFMAAIMRRHVYVPVPSDAAGREMHVTWATLKSSLRKAGIQPDPAW